MKWPDPSVNWLGPSVKWLDPSVRLPEHRADCALSVMAKAPLPGKVKTRLTPPLTLDQSASLNICFLRDTLENIRSVSDATGVVVYTPRGEEKAFEDIVPRDFGMLLQRGEAFGERLLAAAEDLLGCGFASCCLIDSDSPTLPHSALRLAVDALAQPEDRIVLGPTDDGGYYLIGMKSVHATLFENIRWSTSSVFEQTMERAADLGLDVTLLPRWYDVDDGPALERLSEEMFGEGATSIGYAAPHTREFLANLIKRGGPNSIWTPPAKTGAKNGA